MSTHVRSSMYKALIVKTHTCIVFCMLHQFGITSRKHQVDVDASENKYKIKKVRL